MKQLILLLLSPLLFGCATSGIDGLEDFNSKFSQSIPTSPKFKIEEMGGNSYQIVVYQGTPLISEITTRASYLTRATVFAMNNFCSNKGTTLGQNQFSWRRDSLGYVNVIGFFSCQ